MKIHKKISILVTALIVSFSNISYSDTFYGVGDSTTGTYADWMKTVYNRAGMPELLSIPLTTFDKDYNLVPMAAESWSQSDDGLTWTFKLRDGLVWSDGPALKASDYIFALTRAVTTGFDFGWYYSFAAGIKNWNAVSDGSKDVSELGIRAVDDLTIEVTTESVKPYLPGVFSLWFPVAEHAWKKHGDEYAANVDTLPSSYAFIMESWEKSTNKQTFVKNPTYNGPWPAKIDKVIIDPTIGAPEVGFPAYMAGDADMTTLNVGQIPYAKSKFPNDLRTNAIFAVSYISFDLTSAPFDNVDVRKALWYAVDRDEMTNTVLKDLAIPGKSLLAPGFPGYNEKLTEYAVFDPAKAKEHLAKAGYPNGDGFPEIEIWYRDQGGYNGAITAPMLQYLQAEYKEHLGIDMKIKIMSIGEWYDALTNNKNNLFLSPYEYDYMDPSNFYGIFYNGGRHSHYLDSYDKLVAEADAHPDYDVRLKLYESAEMELINNVSIIPLMHPITTSLIKESVKGDGPQNNNLGFAPLNQRSHYFFTHITK